jgi:16S rRNA (cytosine1402-N4)-methyltransferase
MQFDKGYKGFSFSKEGPLDMRMDPESRLTAKEIVNRYSEKELGDIFRDLGEDRQWRRAAQAIVEARRKNPIETTKQLADLLISALGFRGKKRLHPATLIFQALRMAVNHELDAIQTGLSKALSFLSKGGRIGVISFHSLEDRIVKNLFKMASFRKKGDLSEPVLKTLTKKPLVPAFAEIRHNPRARSAKLRFAEKL